MAIVDISKIEPKEIIKGFKGKFIHTVNTTLAFWEVEKGVSAHPHIEPSYLIYKLGNLQRTAANDFRAD